MRAVVQRVSRASVAVSDKIVSKIGNGLVVFLGIGEDDDNFCFEKLADKIVNLRIFPCPKTDRMDLSLLDIRGEILVVSQFTLYANIRKGRRPSFTKAAPPGLALKIYDNFCTYLTTHGVTVKKGLFGECMDITLCNRGPVTIAIDAVKDL